MAVSPSPALAHSWLGSRGNPSTMPSTAASAVYPPYVEDFGYVTLEAFLSGKPVITARDSGGPLEFVVDGVNGFVCEPQPEALGAAYRAMASDPRRAESLGAAGLDRARGITWDNVIDHLLAEQDD